MDFDPGHFGHAWLRFLGIHFGSAATIANAHCNDNDFAV
jgi:hypothetical protein